ncbi:hypothetical protein CSQ85_12820 [Bifidobacterium rousetti]|uniref:hypothetical protein n=1 Tax=Bifidobacterium rousetti TaxID=2045439 RepID=UPI001239BBE3|nr:hypothetical protein [Bifidobacterium rousetti]KAA8815257.1 hypothetical protein CSQ85_12820 [Bifidobacterium rousetti]
MAHDTTTALETLTGILDRIDDMNRTIGVLADKARAVLADAYGPDHADRLTDAIRGATGDQFLAITELRGRVKWEIDHAVPQADDRHDTGERPRTTRTYPIEVTHTYINVVGIRTDSPRQALDVFNQAMQDSEFHDRVESLFTIGQEPWEDSQPGDPDDIDNIDSYLDADLTQDAHKAIQRRAHRRHHTH